MYIPVNPSFNIQKWGLRGSKLYRQVFVMDSNRSAHPRSLIRVFVVRKKKLCILGYPKCAQRRFRSDCANAQADLNLRWAHMSGGAYSDVSAHIQMALAYNFIYIFFFFFFFINLRMKVINNTDSGSVRTVWFVLKVLLISQKRDHIIFCVYW